MHVLEKWKRDASCRAVIRSFDQQAAASVSHPQHRSFEAIAGRSGRYSGTAFMQMDPPTASGRLKSQPFFAGRLKRFQRNGNKQWPVPGTVRPFTGRGECTPCRTQSQVARMQVNFLTTRCWKLRQKNPPIIKSAGWETFIQRISCILLLSHYVKLN